MSPSGVKRWLRSLWCWWFEQHDVEVSGPSTALLVRCRRCDALWREGIGWQS